MYGMTFTNGNVPPDQHFDGGSEVYWCVEGGGGRVGKTVYRTPS